MSRIEKLVEKFLRRPPEVRFEEVEKVLQFFGWKEVNRRGSHRSFSNEMEGIITVPLVKGRKVKRIYLEIIIEKLNLEEWYEKRKG